MLASLRGNQAEAAALIEATLAEAAAAGQGIAVAYANWVAAILANSLGRYTDALAAVWQAAQDLRALHLHVGAARADRGRHPNRGYRHRRRRPYPVGLLGPSSRSPSSAVCPPTCCRVPCIAH